MMSYDLPGHFINRVRFMAVVIASLTTRRAWERGRKG
jgi:hypothetical protein